MKFTFQKGPSILVEFSTSENQIQRIKLYLHSQFAANIIGKASSSLCNQIMCWLENYSNGFIQTSLPLDKTSLTPFRQEVLTTLEKVPYGQILSYKELAKRSHSPLAFRAVGTSCKLNPFPIVIPCHRVISSGGGLGGFYYGLEMKKRLLQFEKAVFPS